MRHRLFVFVIAFALVVAACGGGDDAGADTTTPPPQATEGPTTAAPAPTTTAVPDTAAPDTTAAPETTTTAPETTTTAAASGDGQALKDVQSALAQSSDATSGRMEGLIEIVGAEGMPGDASLAMAFSGAFDNEAEVFQFSMDMSGLAAAAGDEIPPGFEDLFGELEVRQFGDIAYMSFPFFSMFLGVETEWIRFPAEDASSATGSLGGATPSNPADMLSFFAEADATVVEIGQEEVRGVDTTHYSVVVDMEKLLEKATPEERAEIEAQGLPFDQLPMEIWLGADGLVYRYVMNIDGSAVDVAAGEGFERMAMTFEMFDYGDAVDIPEPAPGEYTDGEELGGVFEF